MMKNLFTFLLIVFLTGCYSQIPKDIDGFADASFKAVTSKSEAKYYRKHKQVQSVLMPSINPNAGSGADGLFN